MRYFIAVLIVVALATNASAGNIFWTNGGVGNDFANGSNWNTGVLAVGDDYNIHLTGADRAELGSTLPATTDSDLYIAAHGAVGDGELLVTGGTNTFTNRMRVGRSGNTGTLTIDAGSVSVPLDYSTFGDGGNAYVTMNGGSLSVDRITVGQSPGAWTADVDLTGGTFNISLSDLTPSASTGGTLRLGEGDTTTVDISGTAVVNAEALIMGVNPGNSGMLSIHAGGALHLTGSTMFDFTGGASPDIPIIAFEQTPFFGGEFFGGTIWLYEGGIFDLVGDHTALIDDAIAKGYIVSHGSGTSLESVFAGGLTTLTIVPEPASLGLLIMSGLGCLLTRRRKA
jgi:hypothetical protein